MKKKEVMMNRRWSVLEVFIEIWFLEPQERSEVLWKLRTVMYEVFNARVILINFVLS